MTPFIDGHNDTLLRLMKEQENPLQTFLNNEDPEICELDLPRAQSAGMAAGFFAIFTPPQDSQYIKDSPLRRIDTEEGYRYRPYPPISVDYASRITQRAMQLSLRIESASEGQIKRVKNITDLHAAIDGQYFGMIMHIEGAAAIDEQLRNLEVYYELGLRSLGPVWSRPNVFATGVPFACPSSPDIGPGLTVAGCELVKACNELGIMIDLSHLNEAGFNDIASISNKPLVATHSAVHRIAPTARNLTDRQLDIIKDSGGLVGCNFYVGDLVGDGKDNTATPISAILDHIEYLVDRMGIEHVACGSDFDGAVMSAELKDVSGYPKIFEQLKSRGWSDVNIEQLAYRNWLRVLEQTWTS